MNYNFKRDWYATDSINPEHKDTRIAQASCWIVTNNKKIILVSKDGTDWTVPAGHTEETDGHYNNTAIREVQEETGIDISEYKKDIKVLGYYVVSAFDEFSDKLINKDIQIRLFLKIPTVSNNLEMKPKERDSQVEKIQFVEAFTLEESISKVSWLKKSGDLEEMRKLIDFT